MGLKDSLKYHAMLPIVRSLLQNFMCCNGLWMSVFRRLIHAVWLYAVSSGRRHIKFVIIYCLHVINS